MKVVTNRDEPTKDGEGTKERKSSSHAILMPSVNEIMKVDKNPCKHAELEELLQT
jgi:hypothetical protein